MSHTPPLSKADVVSDFRHTQILDAARICFGRDGVPGTTVEAIAKRAGLAKGTVYLYFQSKQDLLRRVLEDDLAELHGATVPHIGREGAIDERLRAYLAAYLAVFDRKRDFFENLHFGMSPDVRRRSKHKIEALVRAHLDAWRAALDAARRQGLVADIDPDAAAMTIVALAGGLAKQRLRGWATGPVEDVAARAVDTLWKGLTAR